MVGKAVICIQTQLIIVLTFALRIKDDKQ